MFVLADRLASPMSRRSGRLLLYGPNVLGANMRQVFLVALLSVLSISASGRQAGILEQFAGGACTHELEQRNSGPGAKGQGDAVEDHARPRRQREEEETQEQEPRRRGDRRGGVVVDPRTGKAYPRVGNGVVDT